MSRYYAIAGHIENSCYNCSHFSLDETMLTGSCALVQKSKSALGTCDRFHVKSARSDGQRLSLRSAQSTR